MAAVASKKFSKKRTIDLVGKFEDEFDRELTSDERRALKWAEQFVADPYNLNSRNSRGPYPLKKK
jgi:hypothetical protein